MKESAVKRRDTPPEATETARNRCSGNEEKSCVLLLIDNVRGYNLSNR